MTKPNVEKRVLVVDDSAIIRERLQRILDDLQGVTVVGEAEDGRPAVEMVEALRPDVVILDIRMNGGSGIEALDQSNVSTPPPW